MTNIDKKKLIKGKHNNGTGLVWYVQDGNGRLHNTYYSANRGNGYTKVEIQNIFSKKEKKS